MIGSLQTDRIVAAPYGSENMSVSQFPKMILMDYTALISLLAA